MSEVSFDRGFTVQLPIVFCKMILWGQSKRLAECQTTFKLIFEQPIQGKWLAIGQWLAVIFTPDL